jgi:hypothetical protein
MREFHAHGAISDANRVELAITEEGIKRKANVKMKVCEEASR